MTEDWDALVGDLNERREAAAAMTPAVPPSEATPAARRNNAPPEVVLTFPHDAMGATSQSNGATTFASAILTDDDQEMHNLVAWLHGEYVLSRPDPPPVNLMRPPETVVTLRV